MVQGYRDTGIQGYMNIRDNRDIGIQETGIQRYRFIGIQGYRDTGIQ